MSSTLKWFDLALRALMELGIVAALGYWGYRTGDNKGAKKWAPQLPLWALFLGAYPLGI